LSRNALVVILPQHHAAAARRRAPDQAQGRRCFLASPECRYGLGTKL